MSKLTNNNLSEQAAEEIRRMISNGVLPANSRINEVHLSQQLGVSRTPLREALAMLVAEGALENQPRKGNFVRPLTREEFSSLYAMRPILDVEALRMSGVPAQDTIERLVTLNGRLEAAKGVQKRIALDDEWHLVLIENCGNPVLIDLVRQFMFRTRRYEIAYLREAQNVDTATDEHHRVISALQANDLEAACAALKQNLTSGAAPILAWLANMEDSKDVQRT